ncbi:aspartate--tRNA ligase, mitochondrial isoform X3 [Sitodiplosis mosellana]|uniref:aspartate--tRNA ligase, mitochondrial isoform X3 n=1 Tax=Sitodiplosis mosellana TaxID=263140 RepID=UPI002444753E|nr:aspartate--tRNA ligase, mitochondrial isoform X3 [Sitodiplosis mosellana]
MLVTDHITNRHCNTFGSMLRRFDINGIPPRKIPRFMSSMTCPSRMPQCTESNFVMDLSPRSPPPPPRRMNCGELREHHSGTIVEMRGKVNRTRLGRFIELKDQFGVIQLVAPMENINVSKRFANMPVNTFITIVGQVKRRPNNLKNFSLQTGDVEVHVDDIIRVQKVYRHDSLSNEMSGKMHYSTSTATNENCDKDSTGIVTAITSTECKHVNNVDNLVQWFLNRKHTCGSLRVSDAGKIVSLVGWTDKKNPKFMHLIDGYGNMQVLIESDELKSVVSETKSSDLLLVQGRVLARPQSHITHNSPTGEIELYAEKIDILNPETPCLSMNSTNTEPIQSGLCIETDVNEFTYRSHNCGELRESDIGKEVTLCGWLEFSRMKRFFTLRDGYGHTQVLIPDNLVDVVNIKSLNYETILKVKGRVIPRPPSMKNPKMKTGDIEIELISCDVLNKSVASLPVQVRSFNRSNEALRMKYRYVDLRFEDMQRNLRLRSNVLMKMREYLINAAGFVEVETPTLFRRTPGGAQEFVVPTQKPGQFYSLVQSPQQFKQMLMAGAIDRYFQIARCYRDETTTVNRQPEFTQLDIELSFTQPESIMKLIENVLVNSWPKGLPQISNTFRRMTYEEAMETYGSDKPDTRSTEFLLKNVTNSLRQDNDNRSFGAYAIVLPKQTAQQLKKAHEAIVRRIGAQSKNVELIQLKNDENFETSVAKLNGSALAEDWHLQPNDVIIVASGNKPNAQEALGKIRLELIEAIGEIKSQPKNDDVYEFLWIVDFPLFLPNEETGQLETVHHPFTAPHPDDMHLLESADTLDQCRSMAYDLVLNGQEIGGGSIRIHNADLQRRILNDILKLDSDHLTHLIEALESGCPPHGGIALGIDRLISIMCKTNSIRDVIAFPKSAEGKDLLSNAPCQISNEELQLYHLNIKK